MPRKHKYNVAPKNERTYRGVVYHSKAEAIRAAELDRIEAACNIDNWERQVKFRLGDVDYVADFVVRLGAEYWVEEIKGVETQRFKLIRKLWAKYGPCPMLIYKRKKDRWTIERLEGKTDDS